MLIRCIKSFCDLKASGKPIRLEGEVWEADAERLAEINAAGYGRLAEEAPAEERQATAPTAEEIDAMAYAAAVSLCREEGLEVGAHPTKRDAIAALKAHYGLE